VEADCCNGLVRQEPLRDEEISILNGVLELNTKNVEQIMTPMKVTFPVTQRVISDCMGYIGRGDTERLRDSGPQTRRLHVRTHLILPHHQIPDSTTLDS
jgi:hypothetical protein